MSEYDDEAEETIDLVEFRDCPVTHDESDSVIGIIRMMKFEGCSLDEVIAELTQAGFDLEDAKAFAKRAWSLVN